MICRSPRVHDAAGRAGTSSSFARGAAALSSERLSVLTAQCLDFRIARRLNLLIARRLDPLTARSLILLTARSLDFLLALALRLDFLLLRRGVAHGVRGDGHQGSC